MTNQTPDRRKTILILGISSFVGSSLAEFLKKDFRVVGTYNETPVTIPGVLTLPCNVLVKEEVQLILFATKPDYTIYAAGMSSVVDCALEESRADALNTSGVFNVVEYCQRYKSQIIYISSSFVFSGENKSYLEVDIPDPNTTYGRTQASTEFYIQKTSLNYLVIRSCRLYGRNISAKRMNWFEKIQSYFADKKIMTIDDYINIGFLDVNYLGMIIKVCIEKKIQNRLFQVSSADKMSYYDFAKTYAQIFGESEHYLSKGRWSYPIMASAHATQASVDNKLHFKLDVTNAEGFLNVKMPTIEESLEFTFRRLKGVKKEDRKTSQGGGITFI